MFTFQWRDKVLTKAIPRILLLTVFLLLSACGEQAADGTSEDILSSAPQNLSELAVQTRLRTYDAIWETMNEHYVYAGSDAVVDLAAIEGTYRTEATTTVDYTSFREVINEMFSFLPEGSVTWQTRDERIQQEINSSVASGYQGIGAFIAFRAEPEPHVVLMAIIAGSPAEREGLQARDSIYALNGEPFSADETAADIAARVRGPAGSTVTLTVQSPGEERRDVEITRGAIQATATGLQFEYFDNSNILYIEVPRAGYNEMPIELVSNLENFTAEGDLDGIILDMRIATSGASWPIEGMLTIFIDGDIGESFTNSESIPINIAGQDFFNSQDVPLAILIGPDTQGLPELFVSGLQTLGRATVFGLPTPGNVELAQSFPMPDGSQLTVNTASFATPNGTDIGIMGVEPDVPINLFWETQPPDDDEVVNTALQALLDSGG